MLLTMECTMSNAWTMEREGVSNRPRRQQLMEQGVTLMNLRWRPTHVTMCLLIYKQTLNRRKQMRERGKWTSSTKKWFVMTINGNGEERRIRCFAKRWDENQMLHRTNNDNEGGLRMERKPTMAYSVSIEKGECQFLSLQWRRFYNSVMLWQGSNF